MPEQATGPGVVERGHLQKSLKGQRMTTVSFGGITEAMLFVGGWQFRPHRQRVMGHSVPKRSACFSSVSPD